MRFVLVMLIEGFHVTSYQANFASHHTRNRHVSFRFTRAVLENTTKCSVTFYLVHTTIPNYNSMTRILAHTLDGNFESSCEVNQKFKRVFFLFFCFCFFVLFLFCFVLFYCFVCVCGFFFFFFFFFFLLLFFGFVFLYTATYKKETRQRSKIMRVLVCTASCKPSITNVRF